MDEIRCAVEVRNDESRMSPGRLFGTLMQYETRGEYGAEIFKAGSLSWPETGIVVREQHNRQAPIMRVVPEVRGNAVILDAPLPDTSRGRDAATSIRNGLFRGLSIEFRSRQESRVGGVRQIKAAVLTGAGLVDDPSYKGSVVEVREKGGDEHGDIIGWL